MGDSGFIEGVTKNSMDFRTIILAGKTKRIGNAQEFHTAIHLAPGMESSWRQPKRIKM